MRDGQAPTTAQTADSLALPQPAGDGWWLIFGEAEPDDKLSLELADGSRPHVQRMGGIWFAEWCSTRQQIVLIKNGTKRTCLRHAPNWPVDR